MTQTEKDMAELEAALAVVLAHKSKTIVRKIRTDGIDTSLQIVALLAETAAQFARKVDEDQQAVAATYEAIGNYGDALHARLLARSASEYAAYIEQAHEESANAENSAANLIDENEVPTTAEAYAKSCRFYGV